MKIAIVGAGAMGGKFGVMLQDASYDVTLIDKWDAHIQKIKQDGLNVLDNGNQRNIKFKIFKPDEINETFDFIILFTKSMQLENILNETKHIANENTKILCLLNGLGHIETLKKYFKPEQIIMGVTVWTAELYAPGSIGYGGKGAIELQQLAKTDDVNKFVEILNHANLNATLSDDVIKSIWYKAALNCVLNAYCAVLNVNIREFALCDEVNELTDNVVNEIALVAEKENVNVDKQEIIRRIVKVLDPAMAGNHYPSMHQDLYGKRPTEIDYLNGYIAKLGQKYQIPTPYCEVLTKLIKAKEQILQKT